MNIHSIADMAGQRLVSCAVEGVLIALLAFVAIRQMPRSGAGTRFAIWFSALLSIAAMPMFSGLASASTLSSPVAGHLNLPSAWALYALGAWAVIAAIGLLRVAVGVRRVCSLRGHSRQLDLNKLPALCQKTVQEFGSVRHVKVCVSDDVRVPAATGFFRPAVMIPAWALKELTPGELNAVLLHELGHLRRWDDWTNLAQRILGALFFFHPAVWWINSRVSLEREMACDDLVLANANDARGYAECLVSVSEKSALRSGLAMTLAAVSRARHTAVRLARILDPRSTAASRLSRRAFAAVTAVSGAAIAISTYMPPLVAFQDSRIAEVHVVNLPARVQSAAEYSPNIGQSVIRAAVQENDGSRPVNAVLKTVTGKSARSKSKPKLAAVSPRRSSNNARLVRASVGEQFEPTLLLLVERQDIDDAGIPIWSLCVWRVTVVPHKGQTQVRSEAIFESI